MTIHLDISQLLIDPRRSGIQRAERELIRHWPGPAPLVPCRFEARTGQLHELPRAVFEILMADAPPGGTKAERAMLEALGAAPSPVVPGRVLSAELFGDPARARFYRACGPATRAYWLVYDFLPWLHPEWFSPGSAARLMPYIQAMLEVERLAFISEDTREAFRRRVGRREADGPVIPMGGDGLGLERQSFAPGRMAFVMLGTVEARKNAAPAMRAFRLLWDAGSEARLVVIGHASPDAAEELSLLRALGGERRFSYLESLSDGGVRQALRGARAMLFPSEGEGYGIPPMEALHAGIPVITAASLPALAGQPGLGQIRLPTVSAESIAAAVSALMDDTTAERLWAEAGRMTVPGWADFAVRVADWVQA